MKRLLLTAAATLAALNMYAPSTNVLTFSTTSSTSPADKRVWVNTTGRIGDGTQAAGTSYQVALWWLPGGASAGGIQQGNPANFNPAGASGGTWFGGGRTIINPNGTTPGEVLSFQVKGWSQIPGVPNTYDAIYQLGLNGDPRAYVGESAAFTIDTKNPTDPTDLSPDLLHATRSTYSGFSISPVPEPSVIGLGLLGVGALLMLRRRK